MRQLTFTYSARALILLAAAGVLGLTGCKKSAKPVAMSLEQVPAKIETAFDGANPVAKNAAKDIVAAVKGQDPGRAFFALQDLTLQPGLTREQREAAAVAMMTIGQSLQKAAENGDASASSALRIYKATK